MSTSSSTAYDVQLVPYYAHPHVFTVIKDNTFYDETVAVPKDPTDLPYSTIVVTGATKGIDRKFIRLSDLATKKSIFGTGDYKTYGQPSIQADLLFTGKNNVWFCRVLPDDATYANIIVLAHYRRGKVLNDQNNETGLYRLEVKYSLAYCNKPAVTEGATEESVIKAYADSLATSSADPLTGYLTVPLFYVRSIGRGNYGNAYSFSFTRNSSLENDYGIKMYNYNLMETSSTTQVIGQFIGSMYQTVVYGMSSLISDVLSQYDPGMCPIDVYQFEDNHTTIYDFYMNNIVAPNGTYLANSGSATEDEIADQAYAEAILESAFDPVFGLRLKTIDDESIPYYRNYTEKSTGAYVAPSFTVPEVSGAVKPANLSDWTTCFVGATCLVNADPLNNGYQWLYTVTEIDADTGNIAYDAGYEVEIDESEYDGVDLTASTGAYMAGGHDGVFEEITVDGTSRSPIDAEMKLLLAKEYVKAFKGEYDRNILSPSRIKCDFIFDANYNMTSDDIYLEDITIPLYSNSTTLTDEDANQLSILGSTNVVMDFQDINVKRAMYDLNEFRNKSGMIISEYEGAGCSLFLDTNLTGISATSTNYELINMINMLADFTGRATSIDLGYYQIFDPNTRKRVYVTATYFLAEAMMTHINTHGPEKPFQGAYARLTGYQRDSSLIASGNMIKGSFYPDIDLIDYDVKEMLYTSRINYYLTAKEGSQVERGTQNTRQTDASALLEENNVRLLNIIKKELEEANRNYLYNWNEKEARDGYTKAQMEKFRPWIGTKVNDIQIRFDANEFEEERMMMHCYAIVKFRNIIKRIILEINIDRPDVSTGGDS